MATRPHPLQRLQRRSFLASSAFGGSRMSLGLQSQPSIPTAGSSHAAPTVGSALLHYLLGHLSLDLEATLIHGVLMSRL